MRVASSAALRIGDRLGKIVMRIVERLHFGGAIVALVARRDAFCVALQRIDDPGDGRCIAIGDRAAIGLFPPARIGQTGPRG